jgi:hypothetical protein
MKAACKVPAAVRLRSLLFVAACFVAGSYARAAEEGTGPSLASAFASTVSLISVPPGETTVPVTWTYTNRWDFPLVIERIEESCGCLSAGITNDADAIQEVAPGKTGKIEARFTAGGHRGLLRKSIHVRFVGHDKPVELVAEAKIPSHVEISGQELAWKVTDASLPKSVTLTSGTGEGFAITALQGLPADQFTLSQETSGDGTRHEVRITPSGSASGMHILQIHTDSPDPRDRVKAVFLRLPAPPSAP